MKILGMATIPDRSDNLMQILGSISPQVDEVFLALNGYDSFPFSLEYFDNVFPLILKKDRGDAEKFCFFDLRNAKGCLFREDHYADDDYFISWDDDLLMPDGCIKYLIEGIKKYGGIVGFHGRNYHYPVKSYTSSTENCRCLREVKEDTPVNFIGSGCTAFRLKDFNLDLHDFKKPNMADVWLSKRANELKVPMTVLAHKEGYIKYLTPPKGTTIWKTTHDYSYHLEVINGFLK